MPRLNWIQKAIEEPRSFTAQAEAAGGRGVQEYATKVLKKKSKASPKTKKRAQLTKTLKKLSTKKKRS
jgi:hypothetical protein